jgi:hypothetical protein
VIVLDKAGPAERKTRPKVSLYALLALVISSLLSLVIVFFIEGVKRLQSADPTRFNSIMSVLRSDWFGLRLQRKAR